MLVVEWFWLIVAVQYLENYLMCGASEFVNGEGRLFLAKKGIGTTVTKEGKEETVKLRPPPFMMTDRYQRSRSTT